MELKEKFRSVGADIPHIILPTKGIDYSRFSVIACDQFSAQPEYWREVKDIVKDAPSALNIILPEAFLSSESPERIAEINSNMERYLTEQTLTDIGEALVYVERETSSGIRKGLVIALDLEQYDYGKDSSSLIRATEETVVERLPSRIKIRSGAPLELPHVMVLINDKQNLLMGAIESFKESLEKLYDFNLMLGSGNIKGYKLSDDKSLNAVADALLSLKEQAKGGMLYAMGDGNHSFAAAKDCWETIKKSLSQEECLSHPARFCLVELVNLYDSALKFEPIHRVLYNVEPNKLQLEVGFDASNPPSLQELQPKLDVWLKAHSEAEIEYIHGEKDCKELGAAPDRLSVIFPEFDKDSLFDVVLKNGSFVRKSFSMGHAKDKRFYLEAHKIIK